MLGIVVLDTSCYARLEDPAVLNRLNRSLRAVHLEAWPSLINLFELLSTPNPGLRGRRLNTLCRIAAGRPLLPMPQDLLCRVGEAVRDGERKFRLAPTGLEGVPLDPGRAACLQPKALAFCNRVERQFSKRHADARQAVQRFLKQHGKQDAWPSAAGFLDSQWSTRNLLGHFAGLIWRALNLGAAPPIDALLANDTWKLYLEAWGLSVYQRGIMRNQPRHVQRMDLLQVVYLSAGSRGILASADKAFLSAAASLLHRRYLVAEAVHICELLDSAA
jgi:hypothetical protein